MSIFRVALDQGKIAGQGNQGNLEPTAGLVTYNGVTASSQRTVYVMGPKKMNRLLKDGDTFTDCNYWKRFVSSTNGGTSTDDNAFLKIVSDDGGVWSDDVKESVVVVQENVSIQTAFGGSTWLDNANNAIAGNGVIDILATYGGYAYFVTVIGGANATKVVLNPGGSLVSPSGGTQLDIPAGGTLSLNNGDLLVGRIGIQGTPGNTGKIIFGVKGQANS